MIRRKESRFGSEDSFDGVFGPTFVKAPPNWISVSARGLDSQPPGSDGKASRPATVNELKFPPARAAHRWLSNEVDSRGDFPSGTILPLAGAFGD